MTGYLESLKDGVLKPTSERFETLHSEALYLQRLVEDLRLLSLADAGELTFNRVAVQPAELIERLAAKYQHPVEKAGLRMQVEIEAGLETMEVDPDRMMQALDNLMSNAIRWTPAGGEIRLAAGREDGQTRLEIADSGAGIAEEILPHVFERFYRGESARQDSSSGLGLAITRSIIELQGGRIRAESDGQGKGSRFVILMG
jgi:signal transduction histidine kinase